MNVVVLAPHTDDEALGCGGTVAKLAERGYDVFIYAFSCGTSNTGEFHRSAKALGAKSIVIQNIETRKFFEQREAILNLMITIREDHVPKMVFIPASSDCHQDHQVITEEGKRAFKHSTIYGYECPWNSYNFSNSAYSILSGDHLGKKIQALEQYDSQRERPYFKDDAMLSLARVRGLQAGSQYAECFEVIRQFL